MPRASRKICRKAGCNELIDKAGYCDKHKKIDGGFRELDKRKTDETKKFYSSHKWTKASLRHRAIEPLCGRCKDRGIIQKAEMVHHDPELTELLKRGLNPLDDKYLYSLCNRCHLEDLRGKKK